MRWLPKSNWKSLLFALLRIAVVFYGLSLSALYFCQERLIFFPDHLAADYTFHFDSPFEERQLTSAGPKVDSLLFRVPRSQGVILYFHGNAGSLNEWGEAARELAWRTGWTVWIMDYPGYGKSEGRIHSEGQLYEMADAFMTSAQKEFGQVLIYGRSIGTGIAVHAASRSHPVGLILESPYFGLQDLAQTIAPWAPLFLLKYKLESFEYLPMVKAPVLIIHGDQDEVIPYAQGKKLAGLVPLARFVTIEHGHHNDLSESDTYWRALRDFPPLAKKSN